MAQIDAFMMFKGGTKGITIKGESRDLRYGFGSALNVVNALADRGLTYDDAFEVINFRFDGDSEAKATADEGEKDAFRKMPGELARAQFRVLKVEKQIDSATPDLFLAWCKRAKFDRAKIILRKSGGVHLPLGPVSNMPLAFLELRFLNVFIEGLEWDLPGSEMLPRETVRFSCEAMEVSYIPQLAPMVGDVANPLGGMGNPFRINIKGWNIAHNDNWSSESGLTTARINAVGS
jgi:type VI protein secretion system component Hcp